MRKLIFIALLLMSAGCSDRPTEKKTVRSSIKLRQLVKTSDLQKKGSASYFMFMGGASYSEERYESIKVFGKVNGDYRYIDIPLDMVRIRIDNSVKDPYIELISRNDRLTNNDLLGDYYWQLEAFRIVCSEKLLPEKLLPIEL